MLGGKTPHIQNVAGGGVANAINLESQAALNLDRLYSIKALLDKVIPFVQNVYGPDVCAVAGLYPEWSGCGKGVTNYRSVRAGPLDQKSTKYAMGGGYSPNGDLAKFKPIAGQKDE